MTCQLSSDNIIKIKRKLNITSDDICTYLIEELNKSNCMNGWYITELLGIGSVGTVFGICESTRGTECAAIKIQFVDDKNHEKTIKNESKFQKIAHPYAPKILHECFFEIDTQKSYSIVMEQLDGEMDKWLTTLKSYKVLDDIFDQIVELLDVIEDKKLIHGDLAWFNMGYINDSSYTSGIRVILLDFDRASLKINKIIPEASQIDLLRLILELSSKATEEQKKIHTKNATYLSEKLISHGKEKYGRSSSSPKGRRKRSVKRSNSSKRYSSSKSLASSSLASSSLASSSLASLVKRSPFDNIWNDDVFLKDDNIEAIWVDLYEAYCKAAGVKCL